MALGAIGTRAPRLQHLLGVRTACAFQALLTGAADGLLHLSF